MRRVPAMLCVAVLAVGASACGSDDSQLDAQPKTTPDLIAPEDVTLAQPASTTPAAGSTAPTTGTTATPVTPSGSGAGSGGAAAPATPATPPPAATPAPATPAPSTGNSGAGTGGAQQPQTGGATADPGGFKDFCAQNPGVDCGSGGQ